MSSIAFISGLKLTTGHLSTGQRPLLVPGTSPPQLFLDKEPHMLQYWDGKAWPDGKLGEGTVPPDTVTSLIKLTLGTVDERPVLAVSPLTVPEFFLGTDYRQMEFFDQVEWGVIF